MSRAFLRLRSLSGPGLGLAVALSLAAPVAMAAERGALRLQTQEAFLDGLRHGEAFDPTDLAAAFAEVFGALPDEVRVRPTANYYFFAFERHGAIWRGNFRLDATDRDRGVIHFAIHGDNDPGGARGRAFGAADGVKVTRAAPFVYVVHFDGKPVVFRLNDLSGVAPTSAEMRAGETYLGPIEDESGVGFFLVWSDEAANFLYVLDPRRPAEALVATPVSEQLRLGAVTGFAYYRDRYLPRWILVGVRAAEAARNSYFDGPFDQFPDNTVRGEALRRALETVAPEARGRIDRLWNYPGLDARVLARPYLLYSEPDQLAVFDQCAARAPGPDAYYLCFARGRER